VSAFDEAWFLLKALPFKSGGLPFKARPVTPPPPKKFIPGGTTPPKSKFIPGGTTPGTAGGGVGTPMVPPQGLKPGEIRPQQSTGTESGAFTVPGTPGTPTQVAPAAGAGLPLADWWNNHPMNPKTVVNNTPPFGPEGGQ